MSDFVAAGGIAASACREVAENSDIVITCLPTNQSLVQAVSGPQGLTTGAHEGLDVIELSTIPLQVKLAQKTSLETVGATMLDCPISGVPAMAEARTAVLFISGETDVVERCKPVFEAFAPKNFYLGEFGRGLKMKLVANFLVAVHNMAAAEAMVLGTRSGFDPHLMAQVIKASAATSKQFDIRAPLMAKRAFTEPTAPTTLLWDSIEIISTHAADLGLSAPLLTAAKQYYRKMLDLGRGSQDIAAMFEVLDEEAEPAPNGV